MIHKPKGRKYYVVRFRFNGKPIQKRTRATNQKDAKDIEARVRSELARGNFGILNPTLAPTLADFLKKDFLPYTESKFQAGGKTLAYYSYGVKMLTDSGMASLPLDKITDQHARGFEAHYSHLEASTVNCGLRTLRRALALAAEWGKIDRHHKIALAKGENRRERVLSNGEALAYLAACAQPWRDVATIILGTGARPEEIYRLRWEQIEWRDGGGVIRMTRGKTVAAERPLPLLPEVHTALVSRHVAQGCPFEGWVFPSGSASGHLMQGSAKNQHVKALTTLAEAHKEKPKEKPEVKPFPPYTLRHTALTWIAPYTDAYTLAKIAGHTSITMTSRYIHPQQNAIESAFVRMADKMPDSQKVATKAGYQPKLPEVASTPVEDVTDMVSVG